MAHLWGRPPVLHRHCLPSTPQHACHMRPTPPNATPTMSRPLLPQISARPASVSPGRSHGVIVARAAKTKPDEGTKEAVSHLRYTRGSTLKFQRVLDQIRGRSYPEALFLLEHMPFKACEPLKDLLIGVAADAKHNFQMSKSKLFISECYANKAGVIKRFRPRARGRGYRIEKGVSHVTIKVKEGQTLGDQAAPSQA